MPAMFLYRRSGGRPIGGMAPSYRYVEDLDEDTVSRFGQLCARSRFMVRNAG